MPAPRPLSSARTAQLTNAARNASYWARTLGLVAIYFVAGKLGLELAFVHASATAVWLPCCLFVSLPVGVVAATLLATELQRLQESRAIPS